MRKGAATNMDAFKFAFETTIVGLLAVPWLALVINIFLQPFQVNRSEEGRLLSKLLEPAALSILVLVLAYVLGSAVSPLATQLLDDPAMPGIKIRQIRADLYLQYLDWLKVDPSLNSSNSSGRPMSLAGTDLLKCLSPPLAGLPKHRSSKMCWEKADNLFLLQEEAVLREGTDRTARISRLYEQVIVLRGAVFNGVVFVVLCWFAHFSRPRSEAISMSWSNQTMIVRTLMTIILILILFYVAGYLGSFDFVNHHDIVTDPPIMEIGLALLAVVGIVTALRGVARLPYIGAGLVFGVIFTVLAYGAWAWTEVLYTKNTISAFFSWF